MRHLWKGVLLSGVGILATFEAWADIFRRAFENDLSYIFSVPIVGVWLAWVRRKRLVRCPHRGMSFGCALTGIGCAAFLVGEELRFETLWYAGAILVPIGCVVAFAGIDLLRRFLPAAAVLVFLIPYPPITAQHGSASPVGVTLHAAHGVLDSASPAAAHRPRTPTSVTTENFFGWAVNQDGDPVRALAASALASFAVAFGAPLCVHVRLLILSSIPLTSLLFITLGSVLTACLSVDQPVNAVGSTHSISGWMTLPGAVLLLVGILGLCRWLGFPVTPYSVVWRESEQRAGPRCGNRRSTDQLDRCRVLW